jgi:hypothetical protein
MTYHHGILNKCINIYLRYHGDKSCLFNYPSSVNINIYLRYHGDKSCLFNYPSSVNINTGMTYHHGILNKCLYLQFTDEGKLNRHDLSPWYLR